jgi:hypothetical protein
MESKKKKFGFTSNPDSKRGDTTMKKILIATALVIGTVSAASAFEFDGNLANRYPAYAAPKSQVMEGRNVALGGSQTVIVRTPSFDRAGNPNAGGV